MNGRFSYLCTPIIGIGTSQGIWEAFLVFEETDNTHFKALKYQKGCDTIEA